MKIVYLPQLPTILASQRQGKTVVMCHGVYDLFHLGHLHQIREAKSLGHLLVVTVTADQFVNKGSHRPVFSQFQRAEMLASIEYVDYVSINMAPNASEAIALIQPDIYCKGGEYDGKVTPELEAELDALQKHRGRIHYTGGEVFSSSHLLNEFVFNESALAELRKKYSLSYFESLLDRLANLTVTVVGEAIIDDYVFGSVIGKSSKDPSLVMQYQSDNRYAGGSLAIANHVAGVCKRVDLVSYLGSDNPEEELVRSSLRDNVASHFVTKADSPTIVKRRFVDSYFNHKLFELYLVNQKQLTQEESFQIARQIEADTNEAALVCDFGHGLMTVPVISAVAAKNYFLGLNVQCNAGNLGYNFVSKYFAVDSPFKADLLCMDEAELRLEMRDRYGDMADLLGRLYKLANCDTMIVTTGKMGSILTNGAGSLKFPALATKVVDRVGAGDAFFAMSSLFAYLQAPPEVVSFMGNVGGAMVVKTVGNSTPINRNDLERAIKSLLK